jgi:hypothetical protein
MGKHAPTRPLETPREDGGKLVVPPPTDAAVLIEGNRQRLNACDYDLHGQSLAELAAAARRQLLEAALGYTRSYRDVNVRTTIGDGNPISALVLAGHQPELFHPGVWLKNFTLDSVARDNGATAINLLVDSDTIKTSSLRVPTGTPSCRTPRRRLSIGQRLRCRLRNGGLLIATSLRRSPNVRPSESRLWLRRRW